MEVKEAIKFLENELKIHKDILESFGIPEMLKEKRDIKNAINAYQEVITLLKRGEKYEAMWGKFKDKNGGLWGYGKGKYIRELMNDFEQKYFPKNEVTDEKG